MTPAAVQGTSVRVEWERVALCRMPIGQLPPVAMSDEVRSKLEAGAVVAVGVSGGKDSDAAAIAVARYLDRIGHTGPRLLIHADLGRVEWRASLPHCEDLARHLGWELMVVRRRAGDMLARWEGRWVNNLARYIQLTSARLILPWSTPSMRFCTSELKTDVITRALRGRFPTSHIVNVTGIRREESASRARMPVSARLTKLERRAAAGITWNAIIDHTLADVVSEVADAGFHLHPAYTLFDASRVSCVFCIMSTARDMEAAASCEENHEVYGQMVDLEVRSTFAFQGARWLGDIAPHLLTQDVREALERAKAHARRRQELEAAIPKHLLFVPGKPWPQAIPTKEEAEVLANARREIFRMLGVEGAYIEAAAVRSRYEELMAAARVREIDVGDEEIETDEASAERPRA